MSIAEWKTISHAPIYEVSDTGAVRLLVNHGNRRAGMILKGTTIRGYRWYLLKCADGVRRMNSGHALVLIAFVGPRPTPLHHGAHGDGNRGNNSLGNLRWATLQENMNDGVAHGSWKGERHSKAILTEDDVRQARMKHASGEARIVDLARAYGVHFSTMRSVIIRNSWDHV